VVKRSTSQEGSVASIPSRASFDACAETKGQKGQAETAKAKGISVTFFAHLLGSLALDCGDGTLIAG
jgi:hypothetical protein